MISLQLHNHICDIYKDKKMFRVRALTKKGKC